MANTPNMNLELPTPGADDGVWDNKINDALEVVDTHDHTPGKGVPVPTSGINLDADLAFNAHKATELQAAQFENLAAELTGNANANAVQVVDGNLWFTNGSGTAVQVTDGSSVNTPSSSSTPPGIVLPYAGGSAPSGYLLCNGAAVSRVTYADLFAVIGDLYGAGDGSTTFNLPNMIGRTPIGAGTYTDPVSGAITRTLGDDLGAEKHVLTTSEMPVHSHNATSDTTGAHQHYIANTNPVYSDGLTSANYMSNAQVGGPLQANNTAATVGLTSSAGNHSHVITVQNSGGDTAHNIMQPSLVLNYIIKT